MKNLNNLNKYRETSPEILLRFGSFGDSGNGAFVIPSPIKGNMLHIIASTGEGWEHVSVSTYHRCPYWEEMSFVKNKFFRPEETVIQFHPAKSKYVNNHPYCLHLWRPMYQNIPTPPSWMV